MASQHAHAGSTNNHQPPGRVYQWFVLLGLGVIALVLGCLGYWRHFTAEGHHPTILDVLHPTWQLFLLHGAHVVRPNWMLEVARFLAPAVLSYAAAGAFWAAFHERIQQARLRCWKRHVVICGIGRKGMQLVRDFRRQNRRVVALDSDEHNDHLEVCRKLGAVVLIGDVTHSELLEQARIAQAERVIATTGDDGVNLQIATRLRKLPDAKPQHCHVHLVSPTLWKLFQKTSLSAAKPGQPVIKAFNLYANCARQLFTSQPLDGAGITAGSAVTVHLVIVGFGKMGQSVAVQAARIGHFANGRRLRITVIDRNMPEVRDSFLGLYPHFGQVCDVVFIQALAGSGEVYENLLAWAGEPNVRLMVAVCLDNDTRSLSRALAIDEKLATHKVAIAVRMEEDEGLAGLLGGERIQPFGQINRACAHGCLFADELDRIAHRLHRSYQVAIVQDQTKTDDDPARLDWPDLPESYKDANRRVADHVPVKLRAVSLPPNAPPARELTPAEIEILSRMEHSRWLADRLLADWHYAPPPKNDECKTNPNIVPWEQLDEVNKEKDRKAVREMALWLGGDNK